MKTSVHILTLLFFFVGFQSQVFGAVQNGQLIFEQKCLACHSIGGTAKIGPDLLGVGDRRSIDWLKKWIANPDELIGAKDPIAMDLLKKFNQIKMPNLALNPTEVESVLSYIKTAVPAASTINTMPVKQKSGWNPEQGSAQSKALILFVLSMAAIMTVFFWVAQTTKIPADLNIKKAYKLRGVLIMVGSILTVSLLLATIPQSPYYDSTAKDPDRVVYVATKQFSFFFSSEPIRNEADLSTVPSSSTLEILKGSWVEFRVTSLDVNHGFAVFNPLETVVGQTQAMPGYVNRLRLQFDQPGRYSVWCFEFCGVGHHVMNSGFTIK
jgi:cytochrome c oxidase subunit 2